MEEVALSSYINGNHIVSIYSNGTKISQTVNPFSKRLTYDFPESFDFKINDKCNACCKYCHENSSPSGKVPSLEKLLGTKFYNSIHPFTEIAIGGGNVFESPDLKLLLEENKKKNIISNLTVSQIHFKENRKTLESFLDNSLVKGLGISITNPEDKSWQDFHHENLVIHVINGLVDESWIPCLEGRKILVLGFKNKGRGTRYLSDNSFPVLEKQDWLEKNLKRLSGICKSISFDCLGVSQLNPKKNLELTCNDWETLYIGDDELQKDALGNILCSSMFVDYPNMEIARSSTSVKRFTLDLMETIETNFRKTFVK